MNQPLHAYSCAKRIEGSPHCEEWCGYPQRCLSTLTYPESYMQSAYEHGLRDAASRVLPIIDARMQEHERQASDNANPSAMRRRAQGRYGEAKAINEAIRAALAGAPAVQEGDGVEFDWDSNDGELLIDWSPRAGRMMTLSLRADGRLSYAFTWDDEKVHGTAQMPPPAVQDATPMKGQQQ